MKPFRPSLGFVLLCVALLALLAFVLFGSAVVWRMSGNAPITVHGYVAMGLGIGLSLLIGGGLMALAFYSSRRGYDDDQGH